MPPGTRLLGRLRESGSHRSVPALGRGRDRLRAILDGLSGVQVGQVIDAYRQGVLQLVDGLSGEARRRDGKLRDVRPDVLAGKVGVFFPPLPVRVSPPRKSRSGVITP